MHPAALDPELLLSQCKVVRGRASGPGGQHRNKVETAVIVHHVATGIEGQASERRQQSANQRVAIFRLRVQLALTQRGYFALSQVPSALWQSRCRGGRLGINPTHEDFPAILAEALDVIDAKHADVKKAATLLGCSATQLVKLLRVERQALVWVNEQREKRGLGALR